MYRLFSSLMVILLVFGVGMKKIPPLMCSGVGYEVVFHGSTLLAAPVRGAAARVRCNVRCTSRSSRAAREWYSRRLPQGPRTKRAPLCAAHCGFFSVNADFRWYYSIEWGKCQGSAAFTLALRGELWYNSTWKTKMRQSVGAPTPTDLRRC